MPHDSPSPQQARLDEQARLAETINQNNLSELKEQTKQTNMASQPSQPSQPSQTSPVRQAEPTEPAGQPDQPVTPLSRPEDISFEELPITPSDVDFLPPMVHSLVTLLRLLGKTVSPRFIMGGVIGTASSPTACLRAARRAGLEGKIIRQDHLDTLSPLTMPCILLLRNNHSCVLLHLDEGTANIILPEHGEIPTRVPLEQLQGIFTGFVVFGALEKDTASTTERRFQKIRLGEHKHWFWDVLGHYWPMYRHVVVASVAINIIGVASSLFAMNVYDRVVPNNAIETLWVLATGITLAYMCDFLLRNVRNYFVDVAGHNADVVLSSKLVEKVLTMRFDKKPESTGAMVNNLREFEALRDFFSSGTLLTFVDLPFLALFLVMTWFIGGPLVFLPLLAVPVMLGGGLWLQALARRSAEQGFHENMQKNALLVEMVNGLETIKYCMAENRMLQQWEQTVAASALASSHSRRFSSLATTLSSTITQLVTVSMIVWGVYLIAEGRLTMGGLIGCNILVGRAMAPLMQLASMLSRYQQSRMALKSLDVLMETPSENNTEVPSVDFGYLAPSLTLENVSFSYPNAKQLSLDNVSLHIAPGEKVGIIGRMGSGKSTLGKLAVGLYQPNEGTVRFGDVDIRQMDTADLRCRIGFLPQDVVLFYGTMRDNIALDDPSVRDRLVNRAAWISGASEFIRNRPAGLGTQVGERGMQLSGGQRQSIALARAVLHDPEVLVLDEPTSNMDNVTEMLVRTRLKKVLNNKTLVLITHRLSMLELVDRLIVMQDGKIIADGPKKTVLEQLRGEYKA